MNKTAPSGALSPNALAAMACVDAERLIRLQRTLANFGGRPDGGVAREALTAVELDARRWLAQQVQAPQYSWHIDEAANLFLRRTGSEDDVPPVMAGSHPATQPVAGPAVMNGFLYTLVDTSRTDAMPRIGEIAASRLPISCSTSGGTR